MNLRTSALGLVALATAGGASAANLVVNGGFELLEPNAATGEYHICDNTQAGCVSILTGWSATAGIYGASGTNTPGSVLLGGNGGAEFNSGYGLYGPVPDSPLGGNFLSIDGDPQYSQSIFQTIGGLTIGRDYIVSFYQAAGQQIGLTGATTEQWEVNFGGVSKFSTNQFNASESFLPWTLEKLRFTATSTSEVLTFIAHGTPTGQPPVVLLDGVSLNAVPEPASWAMIIAGFGLVGAAARRRRSVVAA